MESGDTFLTNLDELADAMEKGNPMRYKPYNEIAWREVRLFFELDGSIPADLETEAWVGLRLFTGWRNPKVRTFKQAKTLFFEGKTVLRSSKCGEERFHIIHPSVILSTKEYCALIKELQKTFPQLDKTCNDYKAWLRFPKAPKREEARTYHLVKGTYRNAFINASSTAGKAVPAVKVSTKGLVGKGDADLIYKTFGVRVRKGGLISNGRRTYFTIGRATCIHGTVHTKRPVTIHVKDKVYLGKCNDPQCQ